MVIEKNMPKRKAPQVEVPELGKDAAERKRALNVLAQRRYRQRRKEHVKKLEEQVAHHVPSPPLIGQEGDQIPDFPLFTSATQNDKESFTTLDTFTGGSCPSILLGSILDTSLDLNNATEALPNFPAEWELAPLEADLSIETSLAWDSSVLLPPFILTPPSTEDSNSDQDTASAVTPQLSMGLEARSVSPSMSDPTSYQFDFPDEANLKMFQLDLLRATVEIAKRMHIDDILWQLEAVSPYTDPSMQNLSFAHLPMNLWPTKAQQTIQHHPVLDLLPWPTVRNKLLTILSQPSELRPPAAKSETAILDFVYDIEDSAEGVRVWGDDPCSGHNWEVGQKVFERWWWVFDRDIITRSNELRRERGAPVLRGGFIVGEVA